MEELTVSGNRRLALCSRRNSGISIPLTTSSKFSMSGNGDSWLFAIESEVEVGPAATSFAYPSAIAELVVIEVIFPSAREP
jgi:hypothetical protein